MVRWVEYKPGRDNVVADPLSRYDTSQLALVEEKQNLDWPLLIPQYLEHKQFNDDVPSEIKELIQQELHLFPRL